MTRMRQAFGFIPDTHSIVLLGFLVLLAGTTAASGRGCRPGLIPNGEKFSCLTCHIYPGGPRNNFGLDVEFLVSPGSCAPFYDTALANLDSDGDGFTNGEELGDPDGIWRAGDPDPGNPDAVTNPGESFSFPPPPPPLPTPLPSDESVSIRAVASDLAEPTYLTSGGDASGRVYITERAGRIRLMSGGVLRNRAFLNLTGRVRTISPEDGLLSLVFHPNFSTNRRFFVLYVGATAGDLIVEEYAASQADPERADPDSARRILSIPQPTGFGHGGSLAFGPAQDGGHRYLYISTGDGGLEADYAGNAQSLQTLLGKILRIDVDTGEPYEPPASNPFYGIPFSRPEIYARGLRNPWRIAFAPAAGLLFCADVGWARSEEIDLIHAGGNYGWPIREGTECVNAADPFNPLANCTSPSGAISPIAVFPRESAIIGGHVYRGRTVPQLRDRYLFGDFASGRTSALREPSSGGWTAEPVCDPRIAYPDFGMLSSFGADDEGETYLCDIGTGRAYRIVNNLPLAAAAWKKYE